MSSFAVLDSQMSELVSVCKVLFRCRGLVCMLAILTFIRALHKHISLLKQWPSKCLYGFDNY